MMGIKQTLKYLFVFAPALAVEAAPASLWKARVLAARQAAAASGLSDIDIAQFALTAEHLEAAFYNEGLSKFPASDFQALGLTPEDILGLQGVGNTEQAHVSFLLSTIAGAGVIPVSPCQYEFGFQSAEQMVQIARVLEATGISAYLGAAPLITDPNILLSAAEIVTVESRHQTFLRQISGQEAVPAPFDTPLGPTAVFSLLSQFITSCPAGSQLNIQPFTQIQLNDASNVAPGQNLLVDAGSSMPAGAAFCTFLNQNNVQFASIQSDGSCQIPTNLAGETYMLLTSSESAEDSAILAGPSILSIS